MASKNGSKGAQGWAEQDPTTDDGPREGCLPQQCTVKVTGLLDDTSKDLLMNYFENTRRSKGGPICDIEIDRDLRECFITFETPDGKFGGLCSEIWKSDLINFCFLNFVHKDGPARSIWLT